MKSWSVFDLRNNKCAVGLLTIGEEKPKWHPESLYVHVVPGSRDSVSDADLTFFRRKSKNSKWSAVSRSALPNTQEYETIEALFAEPIGDLQTLIRYTLFPLLAKFLKGYSGTSLLVLVDKMEIQELLKNVFSSKFENMKTCVILKQHKSLAGYALLDTNSSALPSEGSSFFADFRNEGDKRCYTWCENRFDEEIVHDTAPDFHVWESEAEMERVGTAIYSLLWEDLILEKLNQKLFDRKEELEAFIKLKTKLERIYHKVENTNHLYMQITGSANI